MEIPKKLHFLKIHVFCLVNLLRSDFKNLIFKGYCMKKYFILFFITLNIGCHEKSNHFISPYTTNIKVKFIDSKIPDGEVFYLNKFLLDYSTIIIDSSIKNNDLLKFRSPSKENFLGIITNKRNETSPMVVVTDDTINIDWYNWKETKKPSKVLGGENTFFKKYQLKYIFPYDRESEVNLEIAKSGTLQLNNKNYAYWSNYEKRLCNWIDQNTDKYYSIIKLYDNRGNLSNGTLLYCLESLKENFKDISTYKRLQGYLKNRKKSQIGEKFTNFEVVNSEQKVLNSKNIFLPDKEKYVIDFGASWCKYCIVQAREINKNYSKIDTTKIQIISISIDENIRDWLSYNKKENYKWESYMANKNKINNIKSIVSLIPAYYVLDKNKKIIGKYNNLETIPFLIFE